MQGWQSYYVLSGIVINVLRTGVRQGLDRAELLQIAQLQDAELCSRDNSIPAFKLMRLASHILLKKPDVHPALAMISMLSSNDLGVISYALHNTPTVGTAFSMFVRYQSLVTNLVTWQLEPKQGRITVDASEPISTFGLPIEGQLGMYMQLAQKLTGRQCRPVSVQFQHPRAFGGRIYHDFFGIEVEHDAPINAISFPPDLFLQPVVAAQPARLPAALTLLDAYLTSMPRSWKDELAVAVRTGLRSGTGDKSSVATSLGLSERTLSRRLRDERTSYTQVLDEVRCDMAQQWLRDPNLAIYEIVCLLGYSEASTFYRAFKRWTGLPPARWRAEQMAALSALSTTTSKPDEQSLSRSA